MDPVTPPPRQLLHALPYLGHPCPRSPLPQGEGEIKVPLSLYIHFPWCARKCPYCDFNSHALRGEVPEQEYVNALIRDLDFELSSPVSRPSTSSGQALPPLVSIFMGGGTPSLFSDLAIGRVLDEVNRRLTFASDIEITLEANPGTVDEAHFRGYRAAGVNRLSIGVQSLNAAHLQSLGRIHDPDQARRAVDVARAAGFDNINLDLMFALPNQSMEQAGEDLRAALALAPEHLSYYHLTLEPNTEFAARPPPLPDTDTAYAMLEQGQSLLDCAGFGQYEVSAYARAGRAARHNLNYWQFGDYLGIGAGAHGKRTLASSRTPPLNPLPQGAGKSIVARRARHKHPKTYLERAGTSAALQEDRAVPVVDLPFEFCMNALRLHEGFALGDFEARTGLSASALDRGLERARNEGLVETASTRIRPSALGRAHLNRLLQHFLP